MNNKEILQIINSDLAYQFEPAEYGFDLLTRTRYTNIKEIDAAYFTTLDGKRAFKVTCEEIPISDLPQKEHAVLTEMLDDLEELRREEEE